MAIILRMREKNNINEFVEGISMYSIINKKDVNKSVRFIFEEKLKDFSFK